MKSCLSFKELLYNSEDSIFNPLSRADKDYLFSHYEQKELPNNSIIYTETNKPKGLICLLKGKIKLTKLGVADREQIISLPKIGDFIGQAALCSACNYAETAQTIEKTTIIIIDKMALFYVMKHNNSFTFALMRIITSDIYFLNKRIIDLTQKNMRGRLADSILYLINNFGVDDNNTINANLSRKDLAGLSNMTISNAIRTLSAFDKETLIKVNKRTIKVIDIKTLEKISETS